MLFTIRLSIILLIAGIFLSPQIIVYAIVRLAARCCRLMLKAITRVRRIARRLLVSGSITEQEVS
jgi:hypothetical protein